MTSIVAFEDLSTPTASKPATFVQPEVVESYLGMASGSTRDFR